MPDLSNFDLAAALTQTGCPLCRVLRQGELRDIASFAREGRFAPQARMRFLRAGGYCPRHAWLLHAFAAETRHGMVIVDLYERLVTSDRNRIRELLDRFAKGRVRRGTQIMRRSGRCPACAEADARLGRKRVFLVELLREQRALQAYLRSDGLCIPHLADVVDAAGRSDPAIARALLEDADRRLRELAADLAEFDRKRDYRYSHEPKGKEQLSWTRVVQLYGGEDFAELAHDRR